MESTAAPAGVDDRASLLNAAYSPDTDCDDEYMTPPDPVQTPATAVADRISNLLGWILVPLLMPLYGAILAFKLSILSFVPTGSRVGFTLATAAFTLAAPALLLWMLKMLGFISDVGLNRRHERSVPYVICILALAGTAWFMAHKGAPMWFVMFFAGGAAAGIVEMTVNFFWKISVHAAGVAGITALLLRITTQNWSAPETMVWLMVSIGAAGLLGAARIWLGRHTLGQVLAGYAVGFCSIYFMTMI